MPSEEMLEELDLQQDMRDITFGLRKQMNDLTARMFLRVTVCFKDIGRFSGKDAQRLYGDSYSGNHIAIFECELKAPPQIAMCDHKYDEFLKAYRVNFRNWKLVDMDNYMEGNHFFSELREEAVWEEGVRKAVGTGTVDMHSDTNYDLASPKYAKEVLIPEVRAIEHHLEKYVDTRSNRKMSPRHKEREEMQHQIEKIKEQDKKDAEAKLEQQKKAEEKKAQKEKKKMEATN